MGIKIFMAMGSSACDVERILFKTADPAPLLLCFEGALSSSDFEANLSCSAASMLPSCV